MDTTDKGKADIFALTIHDVVVVTLISFNRIGTTI